MKQFPRCALAAMVVILGASFASMSFAKVSDEDVRLLVGDDTISKSTEECVRMLTGLDADLYKDLPGEYLGEMKVRCRKSFKKWLDDPIRNPRELTLSDIEDKNFAEQLSTLRKAQLQKQEEERKQEQQRKNVENNKKIEEVKSYIQAALDEGTHFLADAESIQGDITKKCSEWAELDKKLNVAHRPERGVKPFICTSYGAKVKEVKVQVSEAMKRLEKELTGDFSTSLYLTNKKEYYRIKALSTLLEQKQAMEEELEKIKKILAK